MAQEIPVYVFTGFMDSGKTSLVEETLFENEFGDGSKGIIIMCEDGEKEYDEANLSSTTEHGEWTSCLRRASRRDG